MISRSYSSPASTPPRGRREGSPLGCGQFVASQRRNLLSCHERLKRNFVLARRSTLLQSELNTAILKFTNILSPRKSASAAADMSLPRFVFAVFNFQGTTEEDLPLIAGERIEVLSRDDEFGDGWWEGVNERGQQGLFPKIYTSESYPVGGSAGVSQSSLSESLARVDEEAESELSTDAGDEGEDPAPSGGVTQASGPSIESVQTWTPEQVSQHFSTLGLVDVAPKFTEHEVSGRILLEMQHADLREIDINAFGKRFEIMREIDSLRHTGLPNPGYDHPRGDPAGVATPPLDLTQRSSARKSRVLPQDSATGAMLAGSSSSVEEHDIGNVRPLVPRSSSVTATERGTTAPELAPALGHEMEGHKRTDSGIGSSVNSNNTQESAAPGSAMKSTAPGTGSSMHRKSLSTSSIALGSFKQGDTPMGRRSPEKRHSRSWSQDTVKINTHKRGPSGGLGPVGEEVAASIHSADSVPKSPASPASGGLSSPSSAKPSLLSKKSILGRRPKWKPNAVSENLENISAPEAAKDADFSGWLRKRGERSYNWKLRFFVLRGTRLAYYTSDRDTREKGLIDINSHKVSMIDDILFYGPNRHAFKLLPPAPGASRSLNFTLPKTHFFCAESKEQMRQWIAALTKATIGRDWSTPVISSCTTKTISLKAAREQREERSLARAGEDANGQTLQPALDLDNLPSPKVLSPEEIAAKQAARPSAKPDLDIGEGHMSDSSMRRAVLQASSPEGPGA